MEQKRPTPHFASAAYVNGQVMATQALVAAMARLMPDRSGTRAALLQSLELLRVAGLPSGMPDDHLLGIDQTEKTLLALLPASGQR